jgi:hypothetical protein
MRFVTALVSVVAVVAAPPGVQSARVQVYATALNEQGSPVRGLQTGDLVLRDGGVRQAVMDVEPATDPLSVAIVVSGFGTGEITELTGAIDAAARALHAANPATKVGIVVPAGPAAGPALVVEGRDDWRASLARVTSVPLADAILAGCDALDVAPPDRRVVIGIVQTHGAVPAPGADRLATTLAGHRVALWTVEAGVTGPAEWLPGVDKQLTAAVDVGGAVRVPVKGRAAVPAGVASIVDFLASQYVVTYAWPDPMLSQFSLVTRHDAGRVLTPSWNR